MDINKMTTKLQEVFQLASTAAIRENNSDIDLYHFLQALLEQPDTKFTDILRKIGIRKIDALTEKVNILVKELPVVSNPSTMQISRDLAKAVVQMHDIAKNRGDDYVRGELFVPSVISFDNKVKKLFLEFNLKEDKVSSVIDTVLKDKTQSSSQEDIQDILDKYTVDFTKKALENKLDPVIGRSEEIRRTMQILARRTKNNPVLIGHPGVGKTAIIEGLAQRIIADEVPESLKGKRVLGLDLVSLIAGAKMRGDFEERLQNVLKAIQKEQGKIILFIDELHTLVGAGRGEGAMEASNMLKPALARGELRCIGATTFDEYKRYIEKDAALERRFQKIIVDEPNVIDTIAILRGLKERYEIHHGVTITDGAIIAAAKLSKRYITDRFLPDKAIDLIDEAAALIKMEMDSKPEAIDKLEHKIMQLNVELTVLEKDDFSKRQVALIKKELITLDSEKIRLVDIWEKQKAENFSVQELKNNIEKTKEKIKSFTKEANWAEVGKLEYEILPKLVRMLEGKENQKPIKKGTDYEEKLFRKSVTEDEIAHIVSKSTGIEVDKMVQPQKQKLLNMESALHKSIIGQNAAVSSVSKAIRLARAGMSDENRPYGSFLFLGPTGVGKAQPLDSSILTPEGWKQFGSLQIGDSVITPNGNITKVLGIFPQGIKDIYKITFADGRTVESCDQHLWKVYHKHWTHSRKRSNNKDIRNRTSDGYRLLELKEAKKMMSGAKSTKIFVPLIKNQANDVLINNHKEHFIHPYILGVLIGDGCFFKGIRFTCNDAEIITNINNLIREEYKISSHGKYDYSIVKNSPKNILIANEYTLKIAELGLFSKNSHEKFIPEEYMQTSSINKKELLKGLIDTDGHVTKTGSLIYCTTSEILAHQVVELVRSIGGIAKIKEKQTQFIYKGIKKNGKLCYCIKILYHTPKDLVSLSRKLKHLSVNNQYNKEVLKLEITSIDYIGKKEAQCIYIEDEEHLYITDNYVVTHNTQLVKSLAKFLFDSEKNIIRFDMSELMEKHSVSRLIGAPPGYVGYEEGGTLTEAVRRKPYSIILLDEIEKAHPDVYHILLQILDDGRLTDGQGNVVDFKNTVIIMTSNIGSEQIQEEMNNGGSKIGFTTKKASTTDLAKADDYQRMKDIVMKQVKKEFKPELINRIDDIVVFQPLGSSQITDIVKIQLDVLVEKLKDRNINMIFDDHLVDHIVKVGFDPLYGARPIKRVIRNEVESFISDKILEDKIVEGGNYVLCFKNGIVHLKP